MPADGLAHKYRVEVRRAMFDKASYSVYEKYQESIHKDTENSESGYTNFL